MDQSYDQVRKLLTPADFHKLFSIQKNLPDDSPDWLSEWRLRMSTDNAWLLNEVGWEEHR